jgi:hypothetical protein
MPDVIESQYEPVHCQVITPTVKDWPTVGLDGNVIAIVCLKK